MVVEVVALAAIIVADNRAAGQWILVIVSSEVGEKFPWDFWQNRAEERRLPKVNKLLAELKQTTHFRLLKFLQNQPLVPLTFF